MKLDPDYWKKLALICVTGLLLRVVVSAWLGGDIIWSDSKYYLGNANSVLKHGFVPLYRFAPLYSYFISSVFLIFYKSIMVLRVSQAFMWVGIILLFSYVSLAVFNSKRVSIITAALLSFHPAMVYISSEVLSESLYIFCYSMVLMLLYKYMSGRKLALVFLGGLFLGLATLTRSMALLFLPFMMLAVFLQNRGDYYRSIIHSIVFLIAFIAIVFPYAKMIHDRDGVWAVDGYGAYHTWVNTVHPLYSPVNNVIGTYNDLSPEQKERTDKYRPEITGALSLKEKNHLYKEALLRYIRENPWEYTMKLLGKFLNIFRFTPDINSDIIYKKVSDMNLAVGGVMGAVYLTFVIGLVLSWKMTRKILPLLVILFCSMAVFTIFTSALRYTLSILPVMIIFSSYGIDRVVEMRKKRDYSGNDMEPMIFRYRYRKPQQ